MAISPPYGSDQKVAGNAIPVYIAGAPPPPAPGSRGAGWEFIGPLLSNTLGTTGAAGDTLNFLLLCPLSTAPGPVTLQNGSGAPQTVFGGGVGSVTSLVPFTIPVEAPSVGGGWIVVNGANMNVFASGLFT